MQEYTRRAFMRNAGLALMAGAVPSGLFLNMAEAAELSGLLYTPGANNTKTGVQETVCRIDLASHELRSIPVSFKAHSLCPMLGNSARAVAIEKWGYNMAVVDFDGKAVVKQITCAADKAFFGHGTFSADGSAFFVSQANYVTGNGHIAIFDAKSFELIGGYDIQGGVHDCKLGPDNTLFAASNGMKMLEEQRHSPLADRGPVVGTPALIQVDLKDGKTISAREVKSEGMAHFAIGPKGGLAVAVTEKMATPVYGGLYVGHISKDSWRKVAIPREEIEALRGELFSLALDDAEHVLAVTGPRAGKILLVDMEEAEILQNISVASSSASGVAYDSKSGKFVTSGEGSISSLSSKGGMTAVPVKKESYHHHSTLI